MIRDLRADDAAARLRALDVRDSFIVQAPAGSGKTELLTQRFLALLAVVAEPESILAITFTRKAAAEMRERIVGALRAARDQQQSERRHQRETLELAQAVRLADEARGWGLLNNPGRLRIQTIDSLNLGLARRLPVLSGLGSGLAVEEDARELYRLAAERLLGHLLAEDSAHETAVTSLLRHLDNRTQRFIDLVVEMLGRREAWLPALPAGVTDSSAEEGLRESLEAARRSLVGAHLRTLSEAFPPDLLAESVSVATEAAHGLRAAGIDSPLLELAKLTSPPTDGLDDAGLWKALADLLLTREGSARKPRGFNKNHGMAPGPGGKAIKARAAAITGNLAGRAPLCAALHAVRTLPDPGYDAGEWEVLKALLIVLRLAVAELEVVFAERGAADYPRFALAARESLGSPEQPTDTALALDATLHHVLVDEFQDTSEAQVRLLESLTAGWEPGDGRTMFLVGDPMQSIYRFRNAEVGLFLSVRDRGLGEVFLQPLKLHVNFRSTEPVVHWINEAFDRVLPAQDEIMRGAVSYSPSIAAAGAGTDGGVQIHPLLRRSRQHEAEQVADVIERRLGEDSQARIAVLVQGRKHLLHIVATLASRGIAFQATDIDPLGERPIVLDLLALTRALAHLGDRIAWLGVLRAPWCGLSLAELYLLAGDDLEATVPERLKEPAVRARILGDSRQRLERTWSVLEHSLSETRRIGLRDRVERAWLALGGPASAKTPRELDEAMAYLDELAALEQRDSGVPDLQVLAKALEELYAPSSADAGTRVELLTIHKAKGLQFDTVIVPGLERPPGSDRQALLQWMKIPETGRDELVVAPVAGTGEEPNRLYAWLQRLESEKLQQERRRLLYVAATRAERWLHLFGSCRVVDQDDMAKLQQPPETVALGMLWPVVEDIFADRLVEAGGIEGETDFEIERNPPLGRFPAGWRVPDLPATPRVVLPKRSSTPALPPVQFDWASETARHLGTVVHRELQRLASERAIADPQDHRLRARYETELAELGVPVERRTHALERVVTALQRTLNDPRGQWLLFDRHPSAESELALGGLVGGEIVNIVIDRTFVDDDGVRWVVDYKTSSHEGSGLEAFLDREQQRYRAQLERYAVLAAHLGPEPVRLGLYFPLLSAWREWAP